MRRTDLREYATTKLKDAILLLDNQRWSNAYYLAGYSVELGLKACIAKQISADTIPDRSILRDVFSHDVNKLVGLAGLRSELKIEQDDNPAFAANWGIVGEWSPETRYQSADAMSAQLLIQAVSETNHGVLQWIKRYW